MSTDDQDINEQDALTALVASDGWRVFVDWCEKVYGNDACIREIDAALSTVDRGDADGIRATVDQIRSAARAVRTVTHWPTQRIAQLAQPKKASFLGRRRVS